MFTEKAQAAVDLAKDYAYSGGSTVLDLRSVLTAMIADVERGVLLAEAFGVSQQTLREISPAVPEPAACPGKLPLSEAVHSLLTVAQELAEEVPDTSDPGLMDIRHIACALGMSREACAIAKASVLSKEDAVRLLASWSDLTGRRPSLGDLMDRLRRMRADLLARVFGQDHAVHSFVEALFNAEVVASADTNRRAPKAVFVFAGPPGVGKTYLAELGASYLNRPIKRFDMSAFSGLQQNEALVGMGRSFVGAHPGTLTEFVEKNPDAVLLFDEIEKAHINTIQLFLQVLDAGVLEDKYHERNVGFRDTTIIFTTNAGRKLYDRPNESGVQCANSTFHRRTLLDALETETDSTTRQPLFPAAICSRLATGYPILFNYLTVNELESVTRAELLRIGDLIERQYYKRVTIDDLVPMCLVLREGARTDARTLRSQAESFAKSALFEFCQLFESHRLEDALEKIDEVRFALDEGMDALTEEVRVLFEPSHPPKVLLVAGQQITDLYSSSIDGVSWLTANGQDDALELLAREQVDMVMVEQKRSL